MQIENKYYEPMEYNNNAIFTKQIEKLSDKVEYPCYLVTDQATHSGMSIFDAKRRLVATKWVTKEQSENLQEFKLKFKEFLHNLLDEYQIKYVFYERVYGGEYFQTVEVLIAIQELIKDVAYEKSVNAYPLNNKKWKSRLASPILWNTRIDEKDQVRMHVRSIFPLIDDKQDVMDSLGMGIAVLYKTNKVGFGEVFIDKRLPVHTEVWILKKDNISEIYDRLMNHRKFKHKMHKGVQLYYYDSNKELEYQSKELLTYKDQVVVCIIENGRNYGRVLLKYGIKPRDIAEGDILVGISARKY